MKGQNAVGKNDKLLKGLIGEGDLVRGTPIGALAPAGVELDTRNIEGQTRGRRLSCEREGRGE